MNNLSSLYSELEKYKDFDKDDNDEKFLDVVDKIVAFHDPKSLPVLLKYFDDEDSSWVLECLKGSIKTCDYLDKKIYAKGIVENLHILMPKAKQWAEEFIYIIFNEPEGLEVIKQNPALINNENFKGLLNIIYSESPMHRPIVDELKILLEQQGK